jgi:hypothetical protein
MTIPHRAQTGQEVPIQRWDSDVCEHWDRPFGRFVLYADHLAALAAVRADNEAMSIKADTHWEFIADLADILGLPTGKDSADDVLRGVERLYADNEAMGKLLGIAKDALQQIAEAPGFHSSFVAREALHRFPRQANDGGKGETP